MVKYLWIGVVLAAAAALGCPVQAQDYIGVEGDFVGPASVGSQEPLFSYDDQERWKHGYIQVMPFYGGFHSFRPYNYHHVFSQSQTAAGWGMSPTMPYSQQFWHRYEHMTNLNGQQYSAHGFSAGQPTMAQQPPVQYGQPAAAYSHYVPQAAPLAQPVYQTPMQAAPQMVQPQPHYGMPGVAPAQYQPLQAPGAGLWGVDSVPAQPAPTAIQSYLLQGPTLP